MTPRVRPRRPPVTVAVLDVVPGRAFEGAPLEEAAMLSESSAGTI